MVYVIAILKQLQTSNAQHTKNSKEPYIFILRNTLGCELGRLYCQNWMTIQFPT
jgi:pyruvate-formate lyase-activating enzyme